MDYKRGTKLGIRQPAWGLSLKRPTAAPRAEHSWIQCLPMNNTYHLKPAPAKPQVESHIKEGLALEFLMWHSGLRIQIAAALVIVEVGVQSMPPGTSMCLGCSHKNGGMCGRKQI